jgi:hypothetical protein
LIRDVAVHLTSACKQRGDSGQKSCGNPQINVPSEFMPQSSYGMDAASSRDGCASVRISPWLRRFSLSWAPLSYPHRLVPFRYLPRFRLWSEMFSLMPQDLEDQVTKARGIICRDHTLK